MLCIRFVPLCSNILVMHLARSRHGFCYASVMYSYAHPLRVHVSVMHLDATAMSAHLSCTRAWIYFTFVNVLCICYAFCCASVMHLACKHGCMYACMHVCMYASIIHPSIETRPCDGFCCGLAMVSAMCLPTLGLVRCSPNVHFSV